MTIKNDPFNFRKAVLAKPPFSLGGWSKGQPPSTRRRLALTSRSKTLSLNRKRLSAGRALIALANVTRDKETERKARADAKFFFKMLKEGK